MQPGLPLLRWDATGEQSGIRIRPSLRFNKGLQMHKRDALEHLSSDLTVVLGAPKIVAAQLEPVLPN